MCQGLPYVYLQKDAPITSGGTLEVLSITSAYRAEPKCLDDPPPAAHAEIAFDVP